MNILILTQKVDMDDDVLGFMHGWIKEFARYCEKLTVIGLEVGRYQLPQNVRVLSLGKDGEHKKVSSRNPIFQGKPLYVFNFFRHILRERHNYDAVFVHMNPEYVLLGGIIWKLLGKRVGLWYAHGLVDTKLRLAERGADFVFTSTKSGFRLPSKKLHVIGQGIDTERFSITARKYGTQGPPLNSNHQDESLGTFPFRIVMVGRLSPIKDFETLLRAAKRLNDEARNITVDIVGGSETEEQRAYEQTLKTMAGELGLADVVAFHGPLPNSAVGGVLERAHCFVNTSRTGSFDKAVGEAMATGLPILTSNEAFKEVLGPELSTMYMYDSGDDETLAKKLRLFQDMTDTERNTHGKKLREIIVRNHDLGHFIQKIVGCY